MNSHMRYGVKLVGGSHTGLPGQSMARSDKEMRSAQDIGAEMKIIQPVSPHRGRSEVKVGLRTFFHEREIALQETQSVLPTQAEVRPSREQPLTLVFRMSR